MRLLLAACRAGGEAASTPDEPVDADLLVRLARFHRVSGIAWDGRARAPLPEAALSGLRADMLATLHRNLQLAAELKIALRALADADVPVMLLKGARLMDAVYRSPALRPMSDLDLLVRPHDAGAALEALRAEGYAADNRKAAFSLAHDREARLEKSRVHEVVLELHTDLNRPTRHRWFPMDALWARSAPCPFEGEPARALSPADELTFLCAHAVPHAFAQLIWLRDIAGAAGMVGDDGARRVVEAARASRTVRAVRAGLHLAESVLAAPLPPALRAAMGEPDPRMRALLAPERLFGTTRYSTLGSLRFRARLADSPADAARILAAVLIRQARARARGLVPRHRKGPTGL